ncbi:MAG TPA: hypothetical protein VG937_30195 [Polyangiaceae bacterium]|nr:hypothetical protein [Polyangiaceae bacterium]
MTDDLSAARLFARMHTAKLRWIPSKGEWQIRHGKRWRTASKEEVALAAYATADKLLRDAVNSDDELEFKAAQRARSRAGLSGMVAVAKPLLAQIKIPK